MERNINRLSIGGDWLLRLRFRLIKWLAGKDITVLANVEHNHERLSINVPYSLVVKNTGYLDIMPSTARSERLCDQANVLLAKRK